MKTTVTPDGTITVEHGDHAAKAGTWDGETVAGVLVKAEDELRQTLCVAYPADRADKAVAADGHRDFASRAALEKAAHNFLASGAGIGAHHADGTDGAGTTLESYIWAGDDKQFPGSEYTVKEGDWMVKVQWSEAAWADIKAGKIGGVSMQGRARRAAASPDKIAALRSS